MTIAQTNSPVSPSAGAIGEIALTSLTADELEALLEAAAYSLRVEQNLKHSLEDCSTHSMFDTEFLVELQFREESRDELLRLISAIATHLLALEAIEEVGDIKGAKVRTHFNKIAPTVANEKPTRLMGGRSHLGRVGYAASLSSGRYLHKSPG